MIYFHKNIRKVFLKSMGLLGFFFHITNALAADHHPAESEKASYTNGVHALVQEFHQFHGTTDFSNYAQNTSEMTPEAFAALMTEVNPTQPLAAMQEAFKAHKLIPLRPLNKDKLVLFCGNPPTDLYLLYHHPHLNSNGAKQHIETERKLHAHDDAVTVDLTLAVNPTILHEVSGFEGFERLAQYVKTQKIRFSDILSEGGLIELCPKTLKSIASMLQENGTLRFNGGGSFKIPFHNHPPIPQAIRALYEMDRKEAEQKENYFQGQVAQFSSEVNEWVKNQDLYPFVQQYFSDHGFFIDINSLRKTSDGIGPFELTLEKEGPQGWINVGGGNREKGLDFAVSFRYNAPKHMVANIPDKKDQKDEKKEAAGKKEQESTAQKQ